MFGKNRKKFLLRMLSYVLVAVLSSTLTLALWGQRYSKLAELGAIIDKKFIGDADMEEVNDAAASAMIAALGDRWSYYISAEDYAAHLENKNNAYVGIGVTIEKNQDGTGFDIHEVTPGGSAQEAGIKPGDVLVAVDGASAEEMSTDALKDLIRGEKGTKLTVTVQRNEERLEFTVERREIKVTVATGELLDGNIGLVRIANFNAGCAKETIAVIKDLQEKGADKLIFDVRNNPGGYVSEMLQVLDYLLPEGVLYRSQDYMGREEAEYSDASCLEMPMAVLVNGNSYSAAEFFAACLQEKQWATVVGERTTGKGYYQNTIRLSDGSAVNLSTGKYFTPSGANLTELGGLTPDVLAQVDKQTAANIYAQLVPAGEDPQIQAAVEAVVKNEQ